MAAGAAGIVLQPGERTEPGRRPGAWRATLATAAETGGSLGVVEMTTLPGAGPPVHIHRRTDEAFYVLEGEYVITLGEQVATIGPGGFVFIPRGAPHAFKNVGAAPGRLLDIKAPGGWEQLFYERLRLRDDPGAERVAMEQHDEWVVGPPL